MAWAHPEFGQVIASCSFDRAICIWEELEGGAHTTWSRRANLVDSKDNVADIEFAPRHLGLKLATASEDGHVRIYEAMDVMNLTNWVVTEQFDVGRGAGAMRISWNQSRNDVPSLAQAGADGLRIWGYDDPSRAWVVLGRLERPEAPNAAVRDVCWAPSIGRSYHLVATAGDYTVRIWRVRLPSADRPGFEAAVVAEFRDHGCDVWRLQWNVTGTVLASSGDDGAVRLWKSNHLGQWKCISVLSGDKAEMNLVTKFM